jgi:hypothetical protein
MGIALICAQNFWSFLNMAQSADFVIALLRQSFGLLRQKRKAIFVIFGCRL